MASQPFEVNGKLLFAGNDTANNRYHLWVSDGTTGGTALLKSFSYGMYENNSVGYHYYSPIVFNDELYFVADNTGYGPALWKSDATTQGTVLVKSFNGSMDGPYNDDYPSFCISNNQLFFAAGDNAHGVELWKTDGTTIGTVLVKDIASDSFYGSEPSFLTNYNGTVYFSAYNENYGVEIWKSDGTDAGTQILRDILPGAIDGVTNDGYQGSIDPQFTVSGSYLFFTGHKDAVDGEVYLHRTDGTDSGTILLSSTITKYDPLDYHRPWQADVNGEFFFFGYPPNSSGSFLYKSDGTSSGTVNVSTNNALSVASTFFSFQNKLYFHGQEGAYGANGLCVSDGTTSGTSLVYAFPAISSSPDILNFIADGNSFFFNALMKVSNNATNWRMVQSDGTTQNTHIYYGVDALGAPTLYNGKIYFFGLDTITSNTYSLYQLTPVNVGVNEIFSEENFSVFPNPADQFTVCSWSQELATGLGEKEISLVDLAGREILSQKIPEGESQATIDVQSLTDGIYLLKLSGENFIATEKINVLH
jgi:ELWxxDGT repeat protein